jgi:hypothetical protein
MVLAWIERHPLRAAFVAAAIVHGSALLAVGARQGALDAYAFNSPDCREYHELAQSLHRTGTMTRDGQPEIWRTPGYPGFLAAAMLLVGSAPAGLILVQQILGVINTVLLVRVACMAANPRRALVAGAIFLFEPYRLYYGFWLLSETLFTTCLLLMWMLWTRAQRRQAALDFLWLGLLAGGTILVRPLAVLVPAALALATAGLGRRAPRAALKNTAVLLAGACLPPAAWMLRNLLVAGHFALSSQSGVVLAYFKAAEVELWREHRTADRYVETSLDPERAGAPHTVWERIDARLRDELSVTAAVPGGHLRWTDLAQGRHPPGKGFETSAALRRVGLRMVCESPLATLGFCVARAGELLTMPLNLALVRYTGIPPGNWRHAALGVAYTLLVLFAAARLFRGACGAGAVFPLAVLIALLAATTPQLDPRLRVPLIPLLALLAVWPRARNVDAQF